MWMHSLAPLTARNSSSSPRNLCQRSDRLIVFERKQTDKLALHFCNFGLNHAFVFLWRQWECKFDLSPAKHFNIIGSWKAI